MQSYRNCLTIALAGLLTCGTHPSADAQQSPERSDDDGHSLPPDAIYRLGTTAWRDCVACESLHFSPDGKLLAYLRMFRELRILDGQTGKILRAFPLNKLPADADLQHVQLAWSPDGSEIAIRSMAGRVAVLDAHTGQTRWTHQFQSDMPNESHLGPLSYSPRGKTLAVSPFGGSYAVIDRQSGEVLLAQKVPSEVCSLSFTADSSRLLAAAHKPPVRIWELAGEKLLTNWTEQGVENIRAGAISPDGKLAAIACPNVVVVDLTSGEAVARLKIDGDAEEMLQLTFSPDGQRLIAASRFVHVWKTRDWTEAAKLTSDCYFNVTDIAIQPDGQRAAICDGNRIWMWNLETGKLLEDDIPAHHGGVSAIHFSPDGKMLATGSYGKDTHLWDALSGRHLRHLATPGLDLSFSADGQQLFTTFVTAPHLRAWETATGRLLKEWSAGDEYINSYAFSADRTRVAVLHDQLQRNHALERFALPEFVPKEKLQREGHAWAGLLLSPDGGIAAVHAREVQLIDLGQGKLIGTLEETGRTNGLLAFTDDSRFAIVRMADKGIGLWELASLRLAHVLKGHQGYPAGLALSPRGQFAASSDSTLNSREAIGLPREIRLWDLRSGRQIASLRGHESDVSALAFSPDGKMLVSGHRDSTVMAWRVPEVIQSPKRFNSHLAHDEAEQLWEQLSDSDAIAGQAAVAQLAGSPDVALQLVERRLPPGQSPTDAELQPLLQKLDADDFADRAAAAKALANYGNIIAPRLRATIERTESAELRLRCQELLQRAAQQYPQTGPRLRETRAVQLLEWVGDERARRLLQKLALGAAEAHLTQEANAALARLEKLPR